GQSETTAVQPLSPQETKEGSVTDSSLTPKPKRKRSKVSKVEGNLSNEDSTSELIKLEELKGFKVLPILVPKPNGNGDPENIVHYLYFKKHASSSGSEASAPATSPVADESQLLPPGRTIFVTNLPIDCNESDLAQLFTNQALGGGCRVTKVLIRTPNSSCLIPRGVSIDKNNFFKKVTPTSKSLSALFPSPIQLATGRLENALLTYPNYAYVVLKEVAGVERILDYSIRKVSKCDPQLPQADFYAGLCHSSLIRLQLQATKDSNSGIERWLKQYDIQRPDSELLQSYVDEYMGEYKHHKATLQYQQSLSLDVVDEDGFVKVAKGRSSNTAGDGATVKAMSRAMAKQLHSKVASERRKQELLSEDQRMHFYRLQAHESKRA
ncbi:Ribosomal RNA-processing protein 7 A, partial [Massospora cicadina]